MQMSSTLWAILNFFALLKILYFGTWLISLIYILKHLIIYFYTNLQILSLTCNDSKHFIFMSRFNVNSKIFLMDFDIAVVWSINWLFVDIAIVLFNFKIIYCFCILLKRKFQNEMKTFENTWLICNGFHKNVGDEKSS